MNPPRRELQFGDFLKANPGLESPSSSPARKRLPVSPADESSRMSGVSLADLRQLLKEENKTMKEELLADLDVRLGVLEKKVDTRLDSQDLELQRLKHKCESQQAELDLVNLKLEQMDNRNRRNNIIISGIPPPAHGVREDCIQLVEQLCIKRLGMRDVFVNRAHRGKANKFGQMDVVAHLPNDWQLREVFRNAKHLKGSNIFIKKDVIGMAARTEKAMVRFRKLLVAKNVRITVAFECFYFQRTRFYCLQRDGLLVLKQGSICGLYVLSDLLQFDVSDLWALAIGDEKLRFESGGVTGGSLPPDGQSDSVDMVNGGKEPIG